MNAISFISEHTAEYILVPRLVSILSPHFSCIVPFYFWSTREGNSMSRQCGPHQRIRLLSVFARRPKITRPADDRIIMKLNAELFDVARLSGEFGIPVLAAVPVISSVFDATLDAPCQWYRLASDTQDVPDIELTVAPDGAFNDALLADILTGPMTAEELVAIVREAARPLTWEEGLESLRLIRRSRANADRGPQSLTSGYKPFNMFFSGYKPFNIMVIEN